MGLVTVSKDVASYNWVAPGPGSFAIRALLCRA